jgi:hypothetical protein
LLLQDIEQQRRIGKILRPGSRLFNARKIVRTPSTFMGGD